MDDECPANTSSHLPEYIKMLLIFDGIFTSILIASLIFGFVVAGTACLRGVLPPKEELTRFTSVSFIPSSVLTSDTIMTATGRSKKKKPIQLTALPTCTYQPGMFNETDRVCPICLCEFTFGEQLRVLLCAHHFHAACVDEWIIQQGQHQCPICRRQVETEIEKPDTNIHNAGLERDLAIIEMMEPSTSRHQDDLTHITVHDDSIDYE